MKKKDYLKKIIIFLILLLLLIPTIQSSMSPSLKEQNIHHVLEQKQSITLSEISINENSEYVTIALNNTNSFLKEPGKPMLPMFKKTYIFPLGTKIKEIICHFSKINEITIDKKIQPAPYPIPKTKKENRIDASFERVTHEEHHIYQSTESYPSKDFDYSIHCGLHENKRVMFLTINCYPVHYNPQKEKLSIYENIDINISYQSDEKTFFTGTETFDLLIISPNEFNDALQPLIDHKNNLHPPMKTILKNTDVIYDNPKYSSCVDNAEKIKYFIKDAIETWNITYVLLVGGHIGQTDKWYLPVRYSNLHDRDFWNDSYVTDLYFADIYRYNTTLQTYEFDDWDSNNNDVFAEWTWFFENGWWYNLDKKDVFDLYPDVFVGRLPCRNKREVNSIVDKIISYENTAYGSNWFKRMIAVGGDTFDTSTNYFSWDTTKYPDGEYTIYAQCHEQDRSSPIDSVKVKIKNDNIISSAFSKQKNTDNEMINSDTPIIHIVNPLPFSFLNDNVYITVKAYDTHPPWKRITIDVWIKNTDGEIIQDFSGYESDYYHFEGEIETTLAASFLEPLNFQIIKLFSSNGQLTNKNDVKSEIRNGAGFIFLSGHGTPMEWCTHPMCNEYQWIDLYGFQMNHLLNKEKLPICVVGGCHNNQFDVTLMNIWNGFLKYKFSYFLWNEGIECFPKWTWVPNCWSWNLVSQKNGGFIASIGNTGLGWGTVGESCVEYNEGYINTHFFKTYANLSQNGFHHLGQIHSETINEYIDTFDPNNDYIDRKTIEQWVLIGDPSLKIGGYQ